MGEIFFLAVFFIGAVYLYMLTGDFRVSKMDISGGAALFPRLVIILLCICLAIRIAQILLAKEKKEFVWKELFQSTRLYFCIALIIYAALLKPLGYIIATSLFVVAVVNYLYYIQKRSCGKPRDILLRNILLIVFVMAMYFSFSGLLTVNLPKGILA